MTTQSNEPDPDAIIEGLHKIRENLLAEHGNDLRRYAEAARARQAASGRPSVSRPVATDRSLPKTVTDRDIQPG